MTGLRLLLGEPDGVAGFREGRAGALRTTSEDWAIASLYVVTVARVHLSRMAEMVVLDRSYRMAVEAMISMQSIVVMMRRRGWMSREECRRANELTLE